jgi:hypothetical protein
MRLRRVKSLTIDVHRVAQSQQEIDVQQVGCHGASSRNWLTNSNVTTSASGCTGNNGTPLRTAPAACRVNA